MDNVQECDQNLVLLFIYAEFVWYVLDLVSIQSLTGLLATS
jgi:hypothetical protein